MARVQNSHTSPAFLAIVDGVAAQVVLERKDDVVEIMNCEERLYRYAFSAFALSKQFQRNKTATFRQFLVLVEFDDQLICDEQLELFYREVHEEYHRLAQLPVAWPREKIGDLQHLLPWNRI